MKKNIFLFSLLFYFTCQWNLLSGQGTTVSLNDKEYPETAFYSALQLYSKTLGKSNHLNNGREYTYRYSGVEGNPFFGENAWNTGSIYYDNQLYKGVKMKFDVYHNILIIGYFDNKKFFVNLELVTEKIQNFSWPEHHFIKIEADTLKNQGMTSGFYDLLYDGRIDVLAKYTKSIQKNSQSMGYLEAFFSKNIFYIRNGKNIFEVTKKRSILKALADKEPEIKAYIKKYKLKFKDINWRGKQIARIAAYYDSINEK